MPAGETMSESRVRENCMHGLKRRGLEMEHQPPRQSPTLLSGSALRTATVGSTWWGSAPGDAISQPGRSSPFSPLRAKIKG